MSHTSTVFIGTVVISVLLFSTGCVYKLWSAGSTSPQIAGASEDTAAPLTQVSPLSILDIQWSTLRISADSAPMPHNNPSVIVLSREGKFHGFGGCNNITGRYVIDGSHLQFVELSTTRKYCRSVMQLERSFLHALEKTTSWAVSNNRLLLINELGIPLLEFEQSATAN